MSRIGLVAGYGKLPIIFARKAREMGDSVVAFCLKGITDDQITGYAEKVHWFEWGELQKALFALATERIKKIVMLGKVKKEIVFKEDAKLDGKSKDIMGKMGGRRDYSILKEISKFLKPFGIEIIDPTPYLKELVLSPGVITKKKPGKEVSEDIAYGHEVAKELSRFDIGQTVVVKNKTVIALEAVEGTDDTIARAGSLSGPGFTVVKVARPDQDMRFDIPLVGLDTLKSIIQSGGACLALESGKTLLIDKEEVISLADSKGVSIVAI